MELESALVATWRLGMPISQELTFAANLREHNDSLADCFVGATLTNMRVFASPPRHGCTHTHHRHLYVSVSFVHIAGHMWALGREVEQMLECRNVFSGPSIHSYM